MIIDSFYKATELPCKFGFVSDKVLVDYRASRGKLLTGNGSMLLLLRQSGKARLVITGNDCELIHDWKRIHEFFKGMSDAKISRIDLAVDATDKVTLEDIENAYDSGSFRIKGQAPIVKTIGGGFSRPNGEARTITIGKRENGKFFRAYEIGRKKKLQDAGAVRLEVEFRSNARRSISLDAITDPTGYFCGAYPYLRRFGEGQFATTDLRSKIRCSQYEELKNHCKRSYGSLFNFMRQIEISDTKIVDLLCGNGFPKGFAQSSVESLIKNRQPISQPHVGVESGVESEPLESKILLLLESQSISTSGLAKKMDKDKPNRYLHDLLKGMRHKLLIELTIPDKPNSRLQQYRITDMGRQLITSG